MPSLPAASALGALLLLLSCGGAAADAPCVADAWQPSPAASRCLQSSVSGVGDASRHLLGASANGNGTASAAGAASTALPGGGGWVTGRATWYGGTGGPNHGAGPDGMDIYTGCVFPRVAGMLVVVHS